jgi:hypothetical protein
MVYATVSHNICHRRMILQTVLLPSYFENLNFPTSHSSTCSSSCLCFVCGVVPPICSRGSFLHPSSVDYGLSVTFYDGQRPTNSWLPGLALIPSPSQVTQPPCLAAFLCNIALANMLPTTLLVLTTTLGLLGLPTSTPRASPQFQYLCCPCIPALSFMQLSPTTTLCPSLRPCCSICL